MRRIEKEEEHITLIVSMWADGTMSKTGVILPLVHLPNDLESLASDFTWAGSSSGLITREIFENWVKNPFIPEIIRRRGLLNNIRAFALLLLDSYSSRECSETLRQLKELNIYILTFEAHVTHICQPLDVAFKRHLKKLKRRLKGYKGAARRRPLLEITKEALYATSKFP